MAKYTFLVVARQRNATSAPRGKISTMQPGEGNWGQREVLPNFAKVTFDGSTEDVMFVYSQCQYDFDKEVFVHKDTGDIFNSQYDVVGVHEFMDSKSRNRQLATTLTGGFTFDGCDQLRAEHVNPRNERNYWLKVFYVFRQDSGVIDILKAIKYGFHVDLRETFLALSSSIQTKLLELMSDQDASYFRWLCSL